MNAPSTPTQAAAALVPSHMPLRLVLAYLFGTIGLFYLGPFEWPLPSLWPVTVYLATLILALWVGHGYGLRFAPRHMRFGLAKAVFVAGAVSAIVLLLPSSITYTGRWPWQVLEALADQRESYGRLREQLAATEGGRGLIILARTVTYPLVFAVLPLGVIYWRSLSWPLRILLLMTVLCSLIFSALRGTTRELADVIIVGGSAFMISVSRTTMTSARAVQLWKYAIALGVLGCGVLYALVARVNARMGNVTNYSSTCLGEGLVCPDYDKAPYGFLPDSVDSVIATFTGYFSQGYYGLGLALDKDFYWSKGIGHSPAIQAIYELLTGDTTLLRSTYISRLAENGWPGEYYWASLPTWLASDVSFWLVPVLILGLGYLWARSWVDASVGHDDRAAVFFCALMMMLFYFPANNQMMYTLDNYAALLGWGLAWGLTRRSAARVVG